MNPNARTRYRGAVLLLAGLACAAPASAQWTLTANDGKAVLNVGFLAQAQLEELESPGSKDYAQNLFVRRARLMLGGRVDARTAFFLDTDAPNLGKGQATGAKVANTMVLQDLVVTQTLCPEFKIDAGLLLVPVSHHSQQAVGSVLAVDYGPYSFLESDVTDSKVNRDFGLDGRAYLAHRHAELRAGVYQGDRGKNATEPFRTTLRAVYYPFEADTGFFYSGTAFGKRKVVALGGSYDVQKAYAAWAGDVAVDWPVGADCVTLQADVMRYDGGSTFAALPRQDVVLVECGYTFNRAHVTPYVQYATRDYADATRADETKLQGGLAYWFNGHRNSVKLGVAKLTLDGASDGAQVVGQWQVLAY
jgi:hypothetical protein